MFCPKCGAEDQKASQFCRACGSELQTVRTAIERPDSITASAVTAREEIGLAIASKIKEFETAHDLRRAVYELLPAIERFLESPEERRMHCEEKRLQQVREGVLTSVAGLATTLLFMFLRSYKITTHDDILLIVSLAGFGILLIGLGIVVNGLFFTTLTERLVGRAPNPRKQITTGEASVGPLQKMPLSIRPSGSPSVTEGTTRELDNVAK